MNVLTGAARAIIAIAAVFTLMSPAMAQVMNPITPQRVSDLLKAQGYATQITEASAGANPSVSSRVGILDFNVNFDACDEAGAGCEMLIFSAQFKFDDWDRRPSRADLNRWNLNEFGKAVADEEGDPWLDLEINAVGGVTETNFTDTVKWWRVLVGKFSDHIGWEPID